MRDSYGTSGQVETSNGAKRQEAHRTPRGKRATWSGNQLPPRTPTNTKTLGLKKKANHHSVTFFIFYNL
ncbi:hypothetical protein QUF49_01780 [Fictibacillus sp. b24]|uniref:hypothetical protein n=1 Tax=Fictibacillus sp. b24 TaxID=3055863 RepID=UPI0025A2E41D|nr:hypothetical protein [Fictibacillus sp. b24]MDM5314701.1 hypothetical protein [Fictibacillus sp. b24]